MYKRNLWRNKLTLFSSCFNYYFSPETPLVCVSILNTLSVHSSVERVNDAATDDDDTELYLFHFQLNFKRGSNSEK